MIHFKFQMKRQFLLLQSFCLYGRSSGTGILHLNPFSIFLYYGDLNWSFISIFKIIIEVLFPLLSLLRPSELLYLPSFSLEKWNECRIADQEQNELKDILVPTPLLYFIDFLTSIILINLPPSFSFLFTFIFPSSDCILR